MALPVTITGISAAVAPVGPFKSSGLGPLAINPPDINSYTEFGTSAVSRLAQSFTTGVNGGTVSSVTVRLTKSGSPTDNIVASIYATDGSGFPTGAALGTGSIAGSVVPSPSFGNFTIPISSAVLSPSTQYAVALSRSGALDSGNFWGWNRNGAGAYAGGAALREASSAWSLDGGDAWVNINDLVQGTSNYYFFGRDGTTATTLQAFKATAPDTSWSSVATKTGFTTAILNLAAYQVGDVIHLAVQDGTLSSSVATKYVSYNMATDTFLAATETVSAAAALTGQATSGWGCSLVVRSNGEVVAFYSGLQVKVSGTFRAQVYYRRRTGVNTYGTETTLDGALAVDNRSPIAVLGASDRVHLLWFNGTNTLQRHLTSANVLGTVASTGATAAPLDICTINDSGTIRHCGFTAAQTFRWNSADNPTVTAASITFGTPVRTVDENLVTYALYQNSADSDLYVKSSTNFGATFGSGTDVFTATVAATDTNLSKNQTYYNRDSNVVFPYVVNDNGTLKYNEYTVRSLGVSGTLGTIEAADVAAVTGSVSWLAALVATEAADTASLNAQVAWLTTLAATEAADAASIAGQIQWTAQLAATEAVDTAAASGLVGLLGALAAAEAPDIAAGTGTAAWQAALAATEAPDTAAIAGGIVATGTLAADELPDTAALSGSVAAAGVSGVLAATDAADTADISGAIDAGIAEAGLGFEALGALALGEADFPVATGVLAAAEIGDVASVAGQVQWLATLAATEAGDTGAGIGLVGALGTLAAAEAADTAAFSGFVAAAGEVIGALVASEGADVAAFIGQAAEPIFVITGGARRVKRPEPIVGYGFGFLPEIEGEAYGTVRAAGTGAATLPGLAGAAVGTIGVIGHGAGRLSIQASAMGDARASAIIGNGAGVIAGVEGSAFGQCNDDEAAILAWLLAA